ncbi:hypothetical protein GCM10009642_51100 [Nocardiopsis metallicus]
MPGEVVQACQGIGQNFFELGFGGAPHHALNLVRQSKTCGKAQRLAVQSLRTGEVPDLGQRVGEGDGFDSRPVEAPLPLPPLDVSGPVPLPQMRARFPAALAHALRAGRRG